MTRAALHGGGNFAIGASLGGGAVRTIGDTSVTFGVNVSNWKTTTPVTFTSIEFRGADEAEVNEMRWCGGEVNNSSGVTPYTNTTILNAFTDTSFMRGPITP